MWMLLGQIDFYNITKEGKTSFLIYIDFLYDLNKKYI